MRFGAHSPSTRPDSIGILNSFEHMGLGRLAIQDVDVRGRVVGVFIICPGVGVVSLIMRKTDSVEVGVCAVQRYVHYGCAIVEAMRQEKADSNKRMRVAPRGGEPEAQNPPVFAGSFMCGKM